MKKAIIAVALSVAAIGTAVVASDVVEAAPTGCSTVIHALGVERTCTGGSGSQQVIARCTRSGSPDIFVTGNWASAHHTSRAACSSSRQPHYVGYNTRA